VTAVAAIVFGIAIAGIVGFQIALALGAPWGAYAMGGTFPGRFPPRMRVAAVVQAVVLALVGIVVLSHAGLLVPAIAEAVPWAVWLAVGLSGVSLVLNAITPSAGERRLWVPVAVVLLVSSLVVALSA
jgi:hypothetical protein